jgi:hypothetical protein
MRELAAGVGISCAGVWDNFWDKIGPSNGPGTRPYGQRPLSGHTLVLGARSRAGPPRGQVIPSCPQISTDIGEFSTL